MVLSISVATCRIGELFTAPPGGELIVGGTLDQSAQVGSKALVLGKIPVSNTGRGILTWEAKVLGSTSTWLSIQNPSGSSKTDSVRVLLNPAGLDTGLYQDSISITSDVGGTGTVKVNWHIVDCDVKPIQSSGEEKSDTLGAADCGARHEATTQAQFYGFTGTHGDIATVLLSSAFNGFVALDTSLKSTVAPLDSETQCLGDKKNPCIYYFQLPSDATYYIEVSGATAADTGAFRLRLISGNGRDPNSVQSLEQRLLPDSSQVVAIGGPVGASVLIHGVVSDSDLVDSVRLQAEWDTIGAPFQGVIMSTGPWAHNGQVASVTLSGLQDNKDYHWQVRAVDQRGNFSAQGTQWDSLPRGNTPDFTVQIGHDPFVPQNLLQLQADGVQQIPVGGYANTQTVKFSGQVSDQDNGDELHLEVEVEPIGVDTTGVVSPSQSYTTASNNGTSVATVIDPTIQNLTSYHWIARTVDQGGRHSKWVAFGNNNPESTQTDFRDSVNANTNLVWTTQPTQTTAGVAINPAPQITAKNALGQTITTFNNPVTVQLSGPGPFVGSTFTVNAVAGVATFPNLVIDKAGSGYSMVATSGTTNSVPSNSFAIVAAPVSQVVFTTPPTSAIAGVPFSPVVQVSGEDQFSNVNTSFTGSVTLTIATNPGNPPGTLRGTTTVNAVAGVAQFPTVNIDKIGTGYQLRAASGALTSATSGTFNIIAAPVTHLSYTGQPSSAAAGATIAPPVQVAARDSLENTVASFSSSITVAIQTNPPGNGVLSGITTATTGNGHLVGGVGTFNDLNIDKIGNGYTLSATTPAPGVVSALSNPFNITNSSISQTLSTIATPNPTTITASSGSSQSTITVTARDGANNTVQGATVQLSVTGTGNTVLPASATTGATGQATFTLSSTVAEVKTVTAFINSTQVTSSQPTVTVNAGTATSLAFTTQPTTTTAGVALNSGIGGVVVTARDQFGNTATSFNAITLTMSIGAGPVGGVFAPTSTNTAQTTAGVATFANLRIYKAGNGYQLQASGGALTSPLSTPAFSINPAPAVRDTFIVQPAQTAVLARIDSVGGIQVWITDSVGNLVADNTHTVTMTFFDNPTGATLGGTKVKTAVNGVATFLDLTINKIGTYQLNAVSNLSGNPSDQSVSFDIIPGPAKTLVFKPGAPPLNTVAGTSLGTIQVAALDVVGDTAIGFTGPVTLAFGNNAGNGTLTGSPNPATPVGGIATFANFSIDKAGTGYTLAASTPALPSGPVTSGTSAAFNIVAGGASASQSTVLPTTPITACGVPLTCTTGGGTASLITVTVKDNLGNPIQGATVTLADISGSSDVFTQPSGTTGANGQITGTLSSTLAQSKTIQATMTVGANPPVVANATPTVVVNPAAAAVVVFTKEPPASVTAGVTIAPAVQVEVRDQFANKVTTAPNQVTLAFIQAGRGPLNNNVATPSGGTATFPNLNATQATNGLTPDSLLATATGLTPDTSTGFAVNPAAVSATQSTVSASPLTITACQTSCSTGASTASLITVTAKDQFGNGVSGASITIAISGTGGNTTAPVSLTQSANANGVATWTLNSTIAELKTISATAGGVGITQTAGVTVNAGTVSAGQSTVTASPTNITACAASCSTGAGTASLLTVTAKDQFGNGVPSASVTISASGLGNTLNPSGTTQTANSNGVATWTLSSTVPEAKTISASANAVGITQTATVTVGTTGVSASQSTVSASLSSITACQTSCSTGAGTATVITVTAKDQFGNGVGGASVTIAISGTGGNTTSPVSLTQTANGSGIAQWTLNSTIAESKTVSASAGGVSINQTAGVTVNAGSVSAAQSTVTTPQATDSACSTSCMTGAGRASLLTITAKDQFGNVIQGATVSMSGSPVTGNSFTAAPNTNASGVSTSTFNSTKAEGKTISATVGGVLVTQTAAVSVIPAGVNATHSSLTRGQASITACQTSCTVGGGTGSLITVTAKDVFDNLVQNAKVVLSSTGSNPAFNPAPANTNSSGVSTSTFSSTTAEGKTISGTLQVGSGTIVGITQTGSVTVSADVATQLTFTTQPSTSNQNATITPPIVVTAFDQFGNVATGYSSSITLSITNGTGTGGAILGGSNPVSAVNGVATFNGMSIDTSGTGYTLDASDGSLTTTSNPFDIN